LKGSALVAACTLALAVASAPAVSDAQGLPEVERQQKRLFAKVAPAVVFISTPEGLGSGFIVGDRGYVLTNAHVVGTRKRVDVVLHNGDTRVGKVIEVAADGSDLALVDVGKTNVDSLWLSPAAVEVGDWAAAVGHGLGGSWTFTTGMVSNVYPYKDRRPVFQTQIPLNPGNSGGPIVNHRGDVVGIVTSGIVEAQNINFAIRASEALRALGNLGLACRCIEVLAPKGAPVFVGGQMVGKGPRVVVPAPSKPAVEVMVVAGDQMRKRTVPLKHGTAKVNLRGATR